MGIHVSALGYKVTVPLPPPDAPNPHSQSLYTSKSALSPPLPLTLLGNLDSPVRGGGIFTW